MRSSRVSRGKRPARAWPASRWRWSRASCAITAADEEDAKASSRAMIRADMFRLRAALGLAALLVPAIVLADPAPIRLVTPVAGVALRGGESTAISWEADALPPEAEEWEAFLSIDGGQHYSIRITPHL